MPAPLKYRNSKLLCVFFFIWFILILWMFYKYWFRSENTAVRLNSLLIIYSRQPIYTLPPYGTAMSNICLSRVINLFAMVWVQYEWSLKVLDRDLDSRIMVLTSTKSLTRVEPDGLSLGLQQRLWVPIQHPTPLLDANVFCSHMYSYNKLPS